MAFAVVCKSCHAHFLLNDDLLRRRVAGRVVTVRCRQCHTAIEIDASDLDPKAVAAQGAAKEPPPPARPVATLPAKVAPHPPRPAKSSTLMGIGGPPRPAEATELRALSPGLLNVVTAPITTPKTSANGFPEPPPPPQTVEQLSSSDWEIADVAVPAPIEPQPESLDDFVEALPSSRPPPDEDPVPSSSGIPSLMSLAHHENKAPKAPIDDFFANMSAGVSGGGAMPAASGAPTIDVSSLVDARAGTSETSVDLSDFEPPRTAHQTLPLYTVTSEQVAGASAATPATSAPTREGAPATDAPRAQLTERALRTATPAESPAPTSRRPDSVRERKNVIAPATESVPPSPAARRASGWGGFVLLALAASAGFLIWKRSAPAHPSPAASEPSAEVAPPAQATPPSPSPALAEPSPAPDPAASEALEIVEPVREQVPAAAPAKHEKSDASGTQPVTRSQPSATAEAQQSPGSPSPGSRVATGQAEPAPAQEQRPEASTKPAEPAEPAGPFDRDAAAAALTAAAAQASSCRKEGDPSGVASVVLTFAPSGRVTSANVSGPPFAGTKTGGCIAAALRKAKVPPFDGDRVSVSKTIVIQ